MNRESIAAAFEDWFQENFMFPPGTAARKTHVDFGEHLLQLVELMQPAATVEPSDG